MIIFIDVIVKKKSNLPESLPNKHFNYVRMIGLIQVVLWLFIDQIKDQVVPAWSWTSQRSTHPLHVYNKNKVQIS